MCSRTRTKPGWRGGGGGALAAKRAEQARAWMWSEVSETLVAALSARPEVARQLAGLEDQVRAGTITPAATAARLLEAYRGGETEAKP